MAIKAGQILHVANQFLVDRIQTAGPGQLNIPQEKVYELGNYQSVGIVRDVPDLTFSLECLDVDTEVEAILVGKDPTVARDAADGAARTFELSLNKPIDITSPWKSPYGEFTAVHGVAVPSLSLESASYRYGLTENAGETFSLRGDSIFYIPGHPWREEVVVGATPAAAISFTNGPALLYAEGGQSLYALQVTVNGERLNHVAAAPGAGEYTDTAAGITLGEVPAEGDKVVMIYGSATQPTYAQGDHEGISVKPAAIRGKDIDVYFSTEVGGTPVEVRWPDVQSATIDWRVTLEDDREFGNPRVVSREATDVPTVSGAIEVKPRSVQALFTRLRQITGIQDIDQIMGPQSSVAGALRVELRNPESGGTTAVPAGTVLKTHYLPAVRFTMPGYEGRVQQKLTTTLNWESDDGVLKTFKGARPA